MKPLFKVLVSSGFSLLELLLVVVLVAGLVLLAAAGYASTIQSSAVTTGADLVNDAFTEARMSAMAHNTTVEVRLYSVASQANPTPAYSMLQLHWLMADGTTPAVSQVLALPSWVVMDATSAYSPLIGANGQPVTPDPTDPKLNGGTRVFHFLPDGSTDLDPTAKWFLTIRNGPQAEPAQFPPDWACIAVDATSGRAQIYRP